MLLKRAAACTPVTANDGCRLVELLHPRNDGVALPYSLALAEVAAGERTLPHRLGRDEVYLVTAGRGRMHVDGEASEIGPGDAVLIPAGAVQWIEALGGDVLAFAALVSPPWQAEDDVLVPAPG